MANNGAKAMEHALTAGSDVWLNDHKEGWLKARVTKIDGTKATVQTEAGDERISEIEGLPLQNADGRSGVEVRARLSLARQSLIELYTTYLRRRVMRSLS